MSKYIPGFLRSSFLAVGLGLAGNAAHAETIDNQPHTLYGTPDTTAAAATIADKMLEVAGRDILLVSRADIMERHELLMTRVLDHMGVSTIEARFPDHLERAGELLEQFKDVAPEKFLDLKTPEDKMMLAGLTLQLINGSPAALPPDQEDHNICIIVAPDHDLSAQGFIRMLTGLPKNMEGMLHTSISAELMRDTILLHEAAHCNQDATPQNDIIARKISTLEKEIDGDDQAFAAMREHHKGNPELEPALEEFRNSRAISNIRNSGGMHDGPESYLSHGTAIFDTGATQNGIKLSPADVILTTMMVTEMNNGFSSMAYGMMYSFGSQDPEYLAYKEQKGLGSLDIFSSGKFINDKYPFVQYANIKTLRDAFSQIAQGPQGEGQVSPPAITKLMDDYVKAFEHFIPGAENHPMVLAQQELVGDLGARFEDLKNNNQPEKAPAPLADPACALKTEDPKNAEDVLRSLEDFRVCTKRESIRAEQEFWRNFPQQRTDGPTGP